MEIGGSASRWSRNARPCGRRVLKASAVSVDFDEGLQLARFESVEVEFCHARPSNPAVVMLLVTLLHDPRSADSAARSRLRARVNNADHACTTGLPESLKRNSRANALTPQFRSSRPRYRGGVNEKVGRQRERDPAVDWVEMFAGRRHPSTGSVRIDRFSDGAEPPNYRRLAGLAATSTAGDAPSSRCCIERVTKSARSSTESPSSPKPV